MPRPILTLIVTITILSLASVATPAAAQQPDGADVVAPHAIVIDAQSGAVLFERAADEPVPPASLTKIFTAVTAAEITAPDQQMIVSDGDLVGEASMGLVSGETDSFDTLLHGMLLSSGNDAAMTIARNLSATGGRLESATTEPFVAYANARIAELGATGTHLVNPHGLDADGHVSTARDLATITRYGLASLPSFREALGATSYTGSGHSLYSTNQLASSYPGLIGGKTGITDKAGYCLIEVAQQGGRTVIAVLLGSTAVSWYADARSLLDIGFATLAAVPAAPAAQSQPATSNVPGLAVTDAGAERVVTSAAVASRKTHAPGVWVVMALVAIPCLLFAGNLFARIGEGQRRAVRRPRRAASARRVTTVPAGAPADATAPFLTVPPRHATPTRRSARQPRVPEPSIVPSFGD